MVCRAHVNLKGNLKTYIYYSLERLYIVLYKSFTYCFFVYKYLL